MTDDECVAFLQWALPALGLQWAGFRRVRRQVCKRIARRAKTLGLGDAAAYPRYLEAHALEWDELKALCTVSISRFYRDRAVFDCLAARVLPALARAALERRRARLECWSAGCASGEEPYTVAIMCHSILEMQFRVLGTDIDAALLARARTGCYGASSLKELPPAWRSRAFERRAKLFCLRANYRRGVEFERRDLLGEPPQRDFDLVLCRNLAFTYFAPQVARAALERIAARLRAGGALVIGLHEQLPPHAGRLAPWQGCRAIWQRR